MRNPLGAHDLSIDILTRFSIGAHGTHRRPPLWSYDYGYSSATTAVTFLHKIIIVIRREEKKLRKQKKK